MDDKKKGKKPSTYEMLNRLDRKVQDKRDQTQKKDDSYSRSSSDSRKRRSRSRSPQDRDRRPSKKIEEVFLDDEPDRSYGDLYCKACDSHMNSEQMWEAHIQGKRHQKNIKKGDQETKYEVLNEDTLLLPEIQKSSEPIIGLQHCCEIRRPEGKPTYQCFLCSSNVPNGPSLLEHVVGLKHRMAYLKEHDPVKHDLIDKTNLKKGMIEPVVAECIRLHQDKHGTGNMQVKLDKSKPPGSSNQSWKKPYSGDYDNRMKEDRRSNYPGDKSDDSNWRPVSKVRPHFSDDPYEHKQRPPYTDDPYEHIRPPYPEDPYDDRCRYEDRYPPASMPDRYSYYHRDRSPTERMRVPVERMRSPVERMKSPPRRMRSPVPLERNYYDQKIPSAPLRSDPNEHQSEDLRSILEQRRAQEKAVSNSSNPNVFQSLLNIIETMPSMMFLELVLHRVEKMDPTENELSMLQKIGNHMISIVMNRKLQKISPDLLKKYQDDGNARPQPSLEARGAEQEKSANLNKLMDLVSQFSSAQPSSSVDWRSVNYQSPALNPTNDNGPAFMTQTPGSFYNSWSSNVTEIPGLTLSNTNESNAPVAFPQRTFSAETRNATSWPGF